jgi:hypothetical protein
MASNDALDTGRAGKSGPSNTKIPMTGASGSRTSSAVTPPAVGGLRQYSSNRLLSVRGMRPFSAPVDLGVLRTGYLEKINIGPLLITRAPQKRYVVLTERRLHW